MATTLVTGISNLNGIGMFHDDGVHQVEKYLPMLAKLFVEHKMNESYAIGYLHRHFDIPETSVWLHEQVGEADRVLPKDFASLDKSTIQPHSYALDGEEFKVAEWETTRDRSGKALSPEFLEALKAFAKAHGLEESLAIFPRNNKVMIESMLAQGGQILVPETPNHQFPAGTSVEDTQWVFDAPAQVDSLTGTSTFKGQTQCSVNVHGYHFAHESGKLNAATGTLPGGATFKGQTRCTINQHGFHFVHDEGKLDGPTQILPPSGEATFKGQTRCTINQHGFHFVHDEGKMHAPAAITPPSGEATFKGQTRCTINQHGFHFVHDEGKR